MSPPHRPTGGPLCSNFALQNFFYAGDPGQIIKKKWTGRDFQMGCALSLALPAPSPFPSFFMQG